MALSKQIICLLSRPTNTLIEKTHLGMKGLYSILWFYGTYGVFLKRDTRMLSRIKISLSIEKKNYFNQKTFLNQERLQKWDKEKQEQTQRVLEMFSVKCRHFTIKRLVFPISITDLDHTDIEGLYEHKTWQMCEQSVQTANLRPLSL